MKKIAFTNKFNMRGNLTQETLVSLEEDLTTILDAYLDEVKPDELFFYIFRFMSENAVRHSNSSTEALKIIARGVETGVSQC